MRAKKTLGQNFLKNDTIIQKIVSLLICNEKDLIIEIGPGTGALTRYLKDLPAKLLCVEIDLDMRPYLDNLKVDVIYENVLLTDLKEILRRYEYNNLYIIGNLPYYITSPIVEKVINDGLNAEKMVFMVQKEVAQRFSAKPGSSEYGYMTVFLNHYYDVKLEFVVGKENFEPIPGVDSAIITLDRKDSTVIEEPALFFDFVKRCFSLKRKTLKNNLRKDEFAKIAKVLEANNLPKNVRAEELSENIFIELYNSLRN